MKKKSFIDRLLSAIPQSSPDRSEELGREYLAEQLETRVLYSVAPVEVESSTEAVVEEGPAVNETQSEGDFVPIEETVSEAELPVGTTELDETVILTSYDNLTDAEIQELTDAADGMVIAPGNSPGIQNEIGDFSFADNSTFEVEIGGTSPGSLNTEHDQLRVTGGGVTIGTGVTLNTLSWNSFVPQVGDSFTIIEIVDPGESVSGTFDQLGEGGTISNFLGSGLVATIYVSKVERITMML